MCRQYPTGNSEYVVAGSGPANVFLEGTPSSGVGNAGVCCAIG